MHKVFKWIQQYDWFIFIFSNYDETFQVQMNNFYAHLFSMQWTTYSTYKNGKNLTEK